MPDRTHATARYRPDIDRGKGLAILLVVFGHLIANGHPAGNDWYATAKSLIYSFHMPFFMYLSGTVFFLTGKQELSGRRYLGFMGDRFLRLMVPFLVFGLLIVIGKYVFHFFAFVDDAPRSVATGVKEMIADAPDNPAMSIWYVLVLFIFSAAMPLLWQVSGRRWTPLFLLALALYFAPSTDAFYLERVMDYFIFFIAGGLVAARGDVRTAFSSLLPFWWVLFLASTAVVFTPLSADMKLLIPGWHPFRPCTGSSRRAVSRRIAYCSVWAAMRSPSISSTPSPSGLPKRVI
jgi:fucose 4-O-acetylase-like acetyltransferase